MSWLSLLCFVRNARSRHTHNVPHIYPSKQTCCIFFDKIEFLLLIKYVICTRWIQFLLYCTLDLVSALYLVKINIMNNGKSVLSVVSETMQHMATKIEQIRVSTFPDNPKCLLHLLHYIVVIISSKF